MKDPGVQMAGGIPEFITKGIKAVSDVTEAVGKLKIGEKPPAPPTKSAQDAADIADLQKVTTNAGIATKTEAKIAGKIEKAKATAPTPEQVIAEKPSMAGMTDATIPEVPFNMPLMDTTESIKQTMLTLAKNARTSVEMIERFYASNPNAEMNIDLLQGKRT
jgi:tRNA A37 threonylcarbamoyladenosine modification protein TsaB